MKKILAAICLLAGLSGMAFADTASPNYYFVLPSTGIQGSPNWGTKLNVDLVNIDTVIAAGLAIKVTNGATVGTAIGATSATYVLSGGVNFSTITTAINNVINTTNTWTAQQTFQNEITASTNIIVSGAIGIGVTKATATLEIVHPDQISSRWESKGLLIRDTADNYTGLGLYSRNTQEHYIASLNDSVNTYLTIKMRATGSATNAFSAQTWRGSGKVGINQEEPVARLDITSKDDATAPVLQVSSQNASAMFQVFGSGNVTSTGTLTLVNYPADGSVLCFGTAHAIGHCTNTPTLGKCTCTIP